jgi:voltage-gated potassium channel Kch
MTTDSDIIGAETVEAIAAAVLRCPAVARLHSGRFNAITSYLPGRRVVGIALTPSGVTVGVVGRYPGTVAQIAAQVREAVAAVVPGVAVTVAVEDIDIDIDIEDIEDIDIEGIDIAPVDPLEEGDQQEVAVDRDRPRKEGLR